MEKEQVINKGKCRLLSDFMYRNVISYKISGLTYLRHSRGKIMGAKNFYVIKTDF